MPTMETLIYLAAVLKFSSVPTGAFELVGEERRDAIESWLVDKLPELIKSFGVTLLVLYVCVFLLVNIGPYLVLFYIVFGRFITWRIFLAMGEDDIASWAVFDIALSLGILVAAILEKWILPDSWVLAIAYPFEAFSVWANGIPYVDWVLPDYSGKGFLEHFRRVFLAIEDWLWNWLAFLNWGYFFIARGFMLLTVIVIQILFFLGVILGLAFALGLPVHLFIQFSDFVKRRLGIAKGPIPVGAVILWATGESLEFGLKTLERFQR